MRLGTKLIAGGLATLVSAGVLLHNVEKAVENSNRQSYIDKGYPRNPNIIPSPTLFGTPLIVLAVLYRLARNHYRRD